jgi:hypothetical protein
MGSFGCSGYRSDLIEARLVDVGPDAPAKMRASGDDTTIGLRVLSGPGVELVKPER